MNVRKGTPPATVERDLAVDLTRDEVLAILVNYVKTKLGPNIRFDNIAVSADDKDNMQEITLSGVELVPLSWREPSSPLQPTPPATPK